MLNELVKINGNQLITSVDIVAKYFDKNVYDINKKIRTMLKELPSLESEFYKTSYINSRNQKHNTWYMTQKGFSLLAMGFSGKKALEWKCKFYDEFERMRNEIEKSHYAKLHGEIECLNKYLDLYHDNKFTVCVSDICAKVKNITPQECNAFLQGKGVIEKRASGWYPTQDYKESGLVENGYSNNNGDLFGYVRYTQKGEEFVLKLLIESGYELC